MTLETLLKIEGMSCEHCRRTVEKGLFALEGVEKVSVSLESRQAKVLHLPSVDSKRLAQAVESLGYRVLPH